MSRSETNNNNWLPPETESGIETENRTRGFVSAANVEILFERASQEAERSSKEAEEDSPKEEDRRCSDDERREDKFKTTADVKRKPSRIRTGDNIDLKLRNLVPRMVNVVGDIR